MSASKKVTRVTFFTSAHPRKFKDVPGARYKPKVRITRGRRQKVYAPTRTSFKRLSRLLGAKPEQVKDWASRQAKRKAK